MSDITKFAISIVEYVRQGETQTINTFAIYYWDIINWKQKLSACQNNSLFTLLFSHKKNMSCNN